VVTNNTITNDVNGIAFNSNIHVVGDHNHFVNVTNDHLKYTPPAPAAS